MILLPVIIGYGIDFLHDFKAKAFTTSFDLFDQSYTGNCCVLF